MIPLHLKISGFLSYRDPVEVDFTLFNLACIAGPNGAGKSSLLDAVTWCLFGQARKRDDSVINLQSKSAEVSLVFAYEGNVYRVQRIKPRDKTGMLEFHILQNHDEWTGGSGVYVFPAGFPGIRPMKWKPLTEHTLRETETCIEKTLRLDYETFVNASFFLQGKADQFTQQRPGDRKRILSSILGLEIWETYRQAAVDRRKAVENDMAILDGKIAEIQAELSEEETRKSQLEKLEGELERLTQARIAQESVLDSIRKVVATLAEQRKLVDALARQCETAVRRLDELEAKQAARREEEQIHTGILTRAEKIEAAYSAWQQSRIELEGWEKIAVQFREQEKRRQKPLDEINTARTRLEEQLNALLDQKSAIESAQAEMPALRNQLEVSQVARHEDEDRLAERSRLEEELKGARQRQSDARAENPRLKGEMDELKERIRRVAQVEGAVCPICGKPLSAEERQALVDELNQKGRELGDRYRANQTLMQQSDKVVY
ncbi:MAG: SMC family ATPase, partial [Chloroflexota bacterium]